ncbi:MAG: hypothetical protein ACREQY_12350 [Candidatus Binatia bacterium]
MDLEKELRKWREKRAQKPNFSRPQPVTSSSSSTDRRTVRVNGQEVVVVKKSRKALP